MSAIEVSTDAYCISHGKAPRGTGTWAFRVIDCSQGAVETKIWDGSFSACRHQALAYAAANGFDRVEVGP